MGRRASFPSEGGNHAYVTTTVPATVGMSHTTSRLRLRDGLLVSLTLAAGAIDAVSWLSFSKVFSAFMTGNVAFVAFDVGGADSAPPSLCLVALAAFAVGAAVSGFVIGRPGSTAVWPQRVTIALSVVVVIEVFFLVLWLVVGARPSQTQRGLLLAVSAAAMGVQSYAVFALGVRDIFTSAVTATWTVLTGELLHSWAPAGERLRFAGVIAATFGGAAVGSVLIVHARAWAPFFPLVVTALVVAVAALRFGRDPATSSSTIPSPASSPPSPGA